MPSQRNIFNKSKSNPNWKNFKQNSYRSNTKPNKEIPSQKYQQCAETQENMMKLKPRRKEEDEDCTLMQAKFYIQVLFGTIIIVEHCLLNLYQTFGSNFRTKNHPEYEDIFKMTYPLEYKYRLLKLNLS